MDIEDVTREEATEIGAFREDALTEEEALAAVEE